MERSEPTLVPGWLKNAGNSTAGSSISHSDDHPASRVARNKSFVNTSNGHEFGRSTGSEKPTSTYFQRSSSSNSSGSLRSYSTLGRNQRDRDFEKDAYDSREQDNTILGDPRRHRNISDPFGNKPLSKFEGDGLRRSQSMISGKRGDLWPKKVATDSNGKNTNGLVTKGSPVLSTGVSKATFERDFPSLGAEDKVVIPEVGRVPSPGLSSAIQNLPVGTSTSLAGEKWTSALAEVPPMLVGNNGLQVSSSSSISVTLGSTTSLNMAEAVAQGPSRAQTAPQLSGGTQRLEELAIKQSRQLIPVTPFMPKTLALNSSDKQRNKVGQQQQISSLPLNHSPRGGPVKNDVITKASNVGKLHVLKSTREKNGVTPLVKDNSSPASTAASPSVMTVLEKRPTSQARSRNDFFNLVRKKSMPSTVSSDSAVENSHSVDTGTGALPSILDKHSEMEAMPATSQHVEAPLSVSEEKNGSICNGDDISNGEKHHPNTDPIISEEEEAAFLRSLGWEENDEEDDEGGLTEEEINAFHRDLSKYINSKPSLRILQRVQLNCLMPALDSQLGGISSGLSTSDAKLES